MASFFVEKWLRNKSSFIPTFRAFDLSIDLKAQITVRLFIDDINVIEYLGIDNRVSMSPNVVLTSKDHEMPTM
jgi:hypothetical protein